MDAQNLQFNAEIINKIEAFCNSTSELLLLCGFSGCAKSEILNSTLEDIDADTLIFKHLCFENSAIDDFLLNFYDSFRKFSLENKVKLKKSMGENFAQKVSFYFKNTDKNCLIIVDNYELVSNNIEILNFLAHIAKFDNTKLVLVSRNKEINFFINQQLKIETIEITPNTKEIFKQKLKYEQISLPDDTLDKFYELTEGYELYLRMSLRYSKVTGISLIDLIGEFEKKGMEFSDFLILKVISLVPSIYFEFLKNLSAINHAISVEFIENYKLGDTRQIEYLSRNMLISKDENEIFIKGYLKEYFLNTLSVQEKFKIYKNLSDIYEQELAKSPKDRLLRLSRESIRKQMAQVNKNIPNVGKTIKVNQDNFSYISLSQGSSNPWFDKKIIEKKQASLSKKREFSRKRPQKERQQALSEEDKALLKEYRQKKFEQEQSQQIEKGHIDTNSALNIALEYEDDYQYSRANEILAKLKSQIEDEEAKINVLEHLAKNSIKLNSYESALDYYSQISSIYFLKKDWLNYFETVLKSALLYKNLYRFESAKEEFNKIILSDNCSDNNIKSRAYLGLADVLESENLIDEALKNYSLASEYNTGTDSRLNAEITYKTAALYDDIQDFKKAVEFYLKNIEIQNTKQNKWLSQSYINCALINSYNGNTDEAIRLLKLALEADKKDSNFAGVYFGTRELSKLYEADDPYRAVEYMNEAIECAIKMKDSFKEAFACLEIGDIYYNINENEEALINFFKAKRALGDNISDENNEIITRRINDMKIKLSEADFSRIEDEYA